MFIRGGVDFGHLNEKVDGVANDHEHRLHDEEDETDWDEDGAVYEHGTVSIITISNHDTSQGPDEGRVHHEHVTGVDVEDKQLKHEVDDEDDG